MASVTLGNMPDDLLRRLKQSADRNGRSLANEAIVCLERGIAPESPHETAIRLAEIREIRSELVGVYLTEGELRKARDEGRP